MIGEDFRAAKALERLIPTFARIAEGRVYSMEDRLLAIRALVLIRDGAPTPEPSE